MLDVLSPEILHCICRQLNSVLDVCQFRLACKSFAQVGLRSLLPRVTLVTLPKAFQHLSEVADHPVLRHYVQEIVVLTNVLPRYRNVHDFAQQLPPQAMLEWPVNPTEPHATAVDRVAYARHQWPEEKLDEVWKYYKELCAQQQEQERSDGFAGLWEVMVKLTRLRSVQIHPFAAQAGPTPFLWPGSEYSKFTFNLLADMPNNFTSASCLLESMLSAAVVAKTSLEELFVTDLEAKFFQCQGISLDDIKRSFEHLRKISLELKVEDESDPSSWDDCCQILKQDSLHQILDSAAQLERIKIIVPYLPMEEHVASFSLLFHDIVWPRLSLLHLEGFETTSEALVTFLEAHAHSLKILQLSSLKLSGQHVRDWYSFFVRCAASLCLEEARLKGRFTADLSDRADIDYVDMGDDIKHMPITLGDALRALLCSSDVEEEHEMRQDTFGDLLSHGKRRLALGYRMEISVRHPQFLRRYIPV